MKKWFSAILAIVMCIALAGCSDGAYASSSTKSTSQSNISVSSEKTANVTYQDNILSLSFVGKKDMPELKGTFFLDVMAENKSDKEITVALQDVYINGTMVTVGSGVPLTLLPGKSKAQSFFGKYEGTGISSANEIKKVGFKIGVLDKAFDTIETTKSIEIDC